MRLYIYTQQITLLGSNANNESIAGVFYWNLDYNSVDNNVNISSQLSLFLINFWKYIIFASWQNIKQRLIWFGSFRNVIEEPKVK